VVSVSTPDMAAWLLERIAEDEQIARAACTQDNVAEHWQWVAVDTGQAVPDGDLEEAGEEQDLSLRSVETHPPRSGFLSCPLPTFALWNVDHYTAALPHIARHDPARVIAECEAKRRTVQHCREVLTHHVYGDWGATDMAEEVLQHLLRAYTDRPDFPAEWLWRVAR